MSNFSQWWKSYSAKGEVKQFTWVCGTELPLVDEVVRAVRETVNPDSWDYHPFNASEDAAYDIWAAIHQYPIGVRPRLIVVNQAQLLEPMRILELVKNRRLAPATYVVFVSADEKIPREENENGTTSRPVHLRAFTGRGDVVECGPFTQATAKYAVQWVQTLKPMRSGVAAHLLERANGDVRLVRDLCRKLALFPQEPTMVMVNELLKEYPRDTFAGALLALDRKTALIALETLPPEEYANVIGILDANVELAGLVHDMLVSHKPNSEISKAAGSRRFLVPDILPVARHYDPKRRASIRRLLCDADGALRLGERVGVMEAIVTYW